MNLISFPHYTCGGLLCDMLNNTFSEVGVHGCILSIGHNAGKIGDADKVFVDYDVDELMVQLKRFNFADSKWAGTHCWPGKLDLDAFKKIIVITTTTARSKMYRWTRAYYHYYFNSDPWNSVTGQARIDKERETAKNYLIPFAPINYPNIINIEFSEIVEKTTEFKNLVAISDIDKHMDRWQTVNKFLYDTNIWNSAPIKRFYEAEYEQQLSKYYVYN